MKAALAACLAWLAVQPLGGFVDNYPYYAPLGAVVAVSTTVVSSARASAQSILAIVLGAASAIALDAWAGPNALTVAAVVAVGTLIGAWQRLGAMGSWVPISALFVLILGDGDPRQYVAAYAGLTALGAAIGVAINLLLPPLPLDAADAALSHLRETLAAQFDDLADALLAEGPLSSSDWQDRAAVVETVSSETRATVQRAVEAQRVNWRAARWREQAQKQYDAATTLIQLRFIVEDLTGILVHASESADHTPWPAPLRPRIAHALQATADLLRSIDGAGAGPDELRAYDESLDRLVEEVRTARSQTGEDLFAVGSVITTLRRARVEQR